MHVSKYEISLFVILALLATMFLFVDESYADFNFPQDNAYEFIEAQAQEAGLTVDEYVFSQIYMMTVITGKDLVVDNGININMTAEENLAALKATSDYPKWGYLSAQEKSGWTKLDYDSQRFNEMVCASKSDMSSEMSNYYASGGDDFFFGSPAKQFLQNVGNIADQLLTDAVVTYTNVKSIFDADASTNVIAYMANKADYYDGSENVGWPSSVPTDLYVAYTNCVTFYNPNNKRYNYAWSSTDVYTFMIKWEKSSTESHLYLVRFNDSPFQSGSFSNDPNYNVNTGSTHITKNIDGYQVDFEATTRYTSYHDYWKYNMPISTAYSSITYTPASDSELYEAVKFMIGKVQAAETPDVPSYPENDPSDDTELVMPQNLYPTIPWPSFTKDESDDNTGGEGGEGGEGGSTGNPDLDEIIRLLRVNNNLLGNFKFNSDYLKVHDLLVYQQLQQLYNSLSFDDGDLRVYDRRIFALFNQFKSMFHFNGNDLITSDSSTHALLTQILNELRMPNPTNVQQIVGEIDWDKFKRQETDIGDLLVNVAPFCSLFLMKNVVDNIALGNPIVDAKFVMPFNFFGNNESITIDLNFLETAKPAINFFMISLLILSLGRATMSFLQNELI